MVDRHRAARWLWPLFVLLIAGVIVVALMATRDPPTTAADPERAPLVETITVHSARHRQYIPVQGTVTAARRVAVQPQVSGLLEWLHPDLEPGGLIGSGEVLFRIEQEDFELALDDRRSTVAEAEAELRLERGRIEVAEREWELFEEELEQDTTPELALREPQLMAAQARLAAAEAALDQARLDLARTEVRVPFDAMVEREDAAVGQFVSTGAEVASLVATDHFWLQVAVPMAHIGMIDIPHVTADVGARVTVRQQPGHEVLPREGRVIRLLGELSPAGRMARLLIRIDDPLGLDGERGDRDGRRSLPLLLEAFVEATIEGRVVDDLIELPRRALRQADRAYVVTADDTLTIRELDIAWRQADAVLVRAGLADGERVVTSPLALALDGMPVRTDADPEGAAGGRP